MDRTLSADPHDALKRAGFDIAHAFAAGTYNAAIRGTALAPLDTFGRSDAPALLIGNTRALWPPFVAAYQADSTLRDAAHPLDTYVERTLAAAFANTASALRYAHHTDERLVDMVRAASCSGLAVRGPAQLAIHPEFGPWFALRALVVFDAPQHDASSLRARDWCATCSAPCVGAMAAARRGTGDWREWLAVREVCPVGAEHAYGEAQTRYHYTKDRRAVRPIPRG